MKYSRIRIVGHSGSGKTYVSKRIAKIIDAPYLELDSVFWKRKFDTPRKRHLRIKMVDNFLSKNKRWVIEGGGLGTWSKQTFGKSDLIVYLDFPIYIRMFRIVKRHLGRRLAKTEESNETLRSLLDLISLSFERMSKTHPKNPEVVIKPHMKKVVHIKSIKQLNMFLDKLQ